MPKLSKKINRSRKVSRRSAKRSAKRSVRRRTRKTSRRSNRKILKRTSRKNMKGGGVIRGRGDDGGWYTWEEYTGHGSHGDAVEAWQYIDKKEFPY